jgi:hypothetical protein
VLSAGILSTKALGNLFLSFVEESAEIRSPAVIRYLDDIFLFSNNLQELEGDVYRLQLILSERSLYLNAAKTAIGRSELVMKLPKTDEIRKSLLQKRAATIDAAYEDDPEEIHLTTDEFRYLVRLIRRSDVAEEDVELALALITEDEEHADRLARRVFQKYPHLLKNLYSYLSNSAYNGWPLWELLKATSQDAAAHEYTLFWCVRIALDVFSWNNDMAQLIVALYDHPNSTDVVRAAILESRHINHGMLARKEAVLRDAGANILGVSAAVGIRDLESGKRNQLYRYAAQSSPLMYQITRALQKPDPMQ